MPTDACRIVYECTGCGIVLRPKAGDCCVFCSWLNAVPADAGKALRQNGRLSLLFMMVGFLCRRTLKRRYIGKFTELDAAQRGRSIAQPLV